MLRRLFDALYEKLLSRLGLALLALALLVNLAALLAVDRGIAKLEEARGWAEHSRDLMTEILSVQSLLYSDESAQRGFLYTQREDYLERLNDNDGQITSKLARLREQTADNPAQQKRVEHVLALANARINLQNETIAVQHMGRRDAALALVNSDRGKKMMEEIAREISLFLVEEDKLRVHRTRDGADIQLAVRWGFAVILFINALMILASSVTIMRGMAREAVRDKADLVQQGEREAAEVVRHDEREAAEVVRSDEREAAEAARNNEREAVEVARQGERRAAAVAEAELRTTELRALSVHLLRVQEDERRTIARDLHDELGGTLSAIKMDIIMGRDAAAKRSDEKSVARLQRALVSIDSAVKFIRRLIENLRPTLLDNLGFEAALRSMTEQFSERAGCECVISLPEGELELTSAQSTALYRICQEALTNVMKYAKAKHVTIALARNGSHWTLLLGDDGVGLDATKQHRAISHGLLGMRERIVALGGSFDIRGDAGCGTTLTATFPLVDSTPNAAVMDRRKSASLGDHPEG